MGGSGGGYFPSGSANLQKKIENLFRETHELQTNWLVAWSTKSTSPMAAIIPIAQATSNPIAKRITRPAMRMIASSPILIRVYPQVF